MMFTEVERPPKNRRSIADDDMTWHAELEAALQKTAESGRGVVVPLHLFHTSPAKGRLWKRGYSVRHRVRGSNVVAWVEVPATHDEGGETRAE